MSDARSGETVGEPIPTAGCRSSIDIEAVIFDMDGVVTRTAAIHAAAWKDLFDAYLRKRSRSSGESFTAFDAQSDYRSYVDGKPRRDGVRSFLAVREIVLPEGDESDEPEADTVFGLAKRKDGLFEHELEVRGVDLYDSTITLIEELRARGVRIGLVTSSRHGRDILVTAGIDALIDVRIDGIDIDEIGLAGKPAPDAFLECSRLLGTAPSRAIVVEDAVSGVAAGRAGGFGLVVGVDRGGNREALERQGADFVVEDLSELDTDKLNARFVSAQHAASWRVEQQGFDPGRERGVESIFTLGNGYLGVRGALDISLPSSQGDLLVAGVYDRKQAGRPYSEHEFQDPNRGDYPYSELVSLPFPFRLALSANGEKLTLIGSEWRSHKRVLDLRAGVLSGETVFEPKKGNSVTVRTRRCASMDRLHLLLHEIEICLDNYSGTIELNTSTADPELETEHPHLESMPTRIAEGVEVKRYRTKASRIEVAIATRTTLIGSEDENLQWRVKATIGNPLRFRRYIAVYSSRDRKDPAAAALAEVRHREWDQFDDAMTDHERRWEAIWERADIRVGGSPASEQLLRFQSYHLTAAADRDPKISVGGRALSGRAYEGHIFWDAEVFLLPFFLHTQPDVARNMLMYRHSTLDGARRRAAEMGCRGACFAWESTVTGEDVTPRVIVLRSSKREVPIFTGTQQIHVTAGIAHGVWRYFEGTGDEEFLSGPGAEILFETARFWATRSVLEGSQYHIRKVVGPDEYHHGVDDNAYTNWMARFNLQKAAWVGHWLRQHRVEDWVAVTKRLTLEPFELDEWRDVADKLHCPGPNAHGIIEQFEGFFGLGDYELPEAERFKAPIDRLFEWDKINALKLIKQADVLMLPFLFPDQFTDDVVAANYRYYEPLTDHGSSLSPAVHAALAARIGLREQSLDYFEQSLTLDLSNSMGNSALGIHPACMAATWQALVFDLLGVRFTETGPVAHPAAPSRLPDKWLSVALRLAWRGGLHPVEVTR